MEGATWLEHIPRPWLLPASLKFQVRAHGCLECYSKRIDSLQSMGFHMNKRIVPFILLACLAVPAMAKDIDPSNYKPTDHAHIRRWADIEQAVWPLLAANTDLCKAQAGYVPGFQAFLSTGSPGMEIYLVGDGSPAEAAGLQVGDVVTSLNGKDVTHKKKGGEAYNEAYARATKSPNPVRVAFLRDGQINEVSVSAVPACNIKILYTGLPIAAGYNEEHQVLILGNHVDLYSNTDDDVRLYLARDLAKVFLDHRGQKEKTRKLGGLAATVTSFVTGHNVSADTLPSIWANVKHGDRQAREADYLGLYLAARAGVDIRQAPAFWEGVFANRTGSAGVGRVLGNDPPSPERLEGIRLATEEILAKQAADQILNPELPGN